MLKKVICVILVLSFVFMVGSEFQYSTYDMGYQHGKMDGKRDASWLWLFAGAGCNCLGVAVAYFMPGDVPSGKIVGMTPEYTMGYADAYVKAKRWRQVMWASIGWAINSALVGAGASSYTGS